MDEKQKQATLSLGAEWDHVKEMASETILSASGFVRQLIREHGEEMEKKYNKGGGMK